MAVMADKAKSRKGFRRRVGEAASPVELDLEIDLRYHNGIVMYFYNEFVETYGAPMGLHGKEVALSDASQLLALCKKL